MDIGWAQYKQNTSMLSVSLWQNVVGHCRGFFIDHSMILDHECTRRLQWWQGIHKNPSTLLAVRMGQTEKRESINLDSSVKNRHQEPMSQRSSKLPVQHCRSVLEDVQTENSTASQVEKPMVTTGVSISRKLCLIIIRTRIYVRPEIECCLQRKRVISGWCSLLSLYLH